MSDLIQTAQKYRDHLKIELARTEEFLAFAEKLKRREAQTAAAAETPRPSSAGPTPVAAAGANGGGQMFRSGAGNPQK